MTSSWMITSMLKIVLDTNMVLSASLFGGMVEIIVELIVQGKLKFFISPKLIDEIFTKLTEYQASEAIIQKAITVLEKGVVLIPKIKK